MSDPSMKQVWAGMAMMALLSRHDYRGSMEDVAQEAWDMAEHMEREEGDRDK